MTLLEKSWTLALFVAKGNFVCMVADDAGLALVAAGNNYHWLNN